MSPEPILLDEGLFTEAFLPDTLVNRESQIKEIARYLEPVNHGKAGRNLFIRGPPGTGKTSVCQFVLKERFPNSSVYVNAWRKRSSHKVLEAILEQRGKMVKGRQSVSDFLRKFEELRAKMVVCIDECDQLEDHDILYFLGRSSCPIVLISNQHSFPLIAADPRIKSSLLLREVEFKPYSADEIYQILRNRVMHGIRPGAIDDSLLSVVAKVSNGDARVALQTIRIAAREAEDKGANGITIVEIRSAIQDSRKYRLSYLLAKLNDHQRTLYEILKQNGSMESGKLYEEYCKKTEKHVMDRTYRNFMQQLVDLNLVRSDGISRWKRYEAVL